MSTGTRSRPPGATVRLRPGVLVDPTPDGVLVRGWADGFTFTGSSDVSTLWRRLRPLVEAGIDAEAVAAMADRSGPWRAAAQLLTALEEHGMLMPIPTGDAPAPPIPTSAWLLRAAANPERAHRRMTGVSVVVCGDGPVADAAGRALRAAGVAAPVDRATGPLVTLRADPPDGQRPEQVVTAAGARVGFVGPSGAHPSTGRRISERLAVGSQDPPELLAEAVGAAAAHRLLARLAGVEGPTTTAHPWPTVLVADAEPLAVRAHPWTPGVEPGRRGDLDLDLDATIAALCDPRLGVLPALDLETPTQIPAALARCGADVIGLGTTMAAARYDAALRAAERLVDPERNGRIAVGADAVHAEGVLLRRVAYALVGRQAAADAPAGPLNCDDPDARRWWATLTRRFRVDARCSVAPLADDVHVAVVADTTGRELGWAVEATAASALAFATFLAVARHQARLAGLPGDERSVTVCGAAPSSPVAAVWPRRDPDEGTWQRSLRRWCPDGPRRYADVAGVRSTLAGVGLTVLEVRS